jgi:putative flavoprotein involved in K+ transport
VASPIIEADGRIATAGTRAVSCSTLWLVGYGEWTEYASATLVGVMRSARATAAEIGQAVSSARGDKDV